MFSFLQNKAADLNVSHTSAVLYALGMDRTKNKDGLKQNK